jgi:hypothetical protein
MIVPVRLKSRLPANGCWRISVLPNFAGKKGAHANAKLIIHENPVGGLRLRGESGLCEDYL